MALIPPPGEHAGKVVAWDRGDGGVPEHYQRWWILDPREPGSSGGVKFINRWLAMPPDEGDLFCAGLTWTPDGRLCVAGGTTVFPPGASLGEEDWPSTRPGFGGGRMVWLFEPTMPDPNPVIPHAGRWTNLQNMQTYRWYPTLTWEAQDRLIIAGGTHNNLPISTNNYEALHLIAGTFNPPIWSWDTNINNSMVTQQRVYPGPTGSTPYFGDYPRMHMLTNGQVFYSGFSHNSVRQLHPILFNVPLPGWDNSIGNGGGWGFDRGYGSHFILPKPVPGAWDFIVRTGGYTAVTGGGIGATNTVDVINAAVAASQWVSALSMTHARFQHNTVLLPDGTVLAVGGQRIDVSPYDCGSIQANPGSTNTPAVYHPEILSTSGWTVVAPHVSPHLYHSTAMLLPDARVLVAGGECRTWDYEVYKPPYLTNGKPRPTGVTVSATNLAYGTSYSVTWNEFGNPLVTVDKVVLMRPGAVTHHTDSDQRYIELQSTLDTSQDPAIRRFFTTPATVQQAPKGWFMLFLLTNDKVPSVAKWINLQ